MLDKEARLWPYTKDIHCMSFVGVEQERGSEPPVRKPVDLPLFVELGCGTIETMYVPSYVHIRGADDSSARNMCVESLLLCTLRAEYLVDACGDVRSESR